MSSVHASSFDAGVHDFIERAVGRNPKGRVVLRYFSAKSDKLPTLEGLGAGRGVSRQYIHQLVNRGRRLMAQPDALRLWPEFWAATEEILKQNAGFTSLVRLADALAGRFRWKEKPNPTVLGRILAVNPLFRVDRRRGYAYLASFLCADCPCPVEQLPLLLRAGIGELSLAEAGRALARRCRKACSRDTDRPREFNPDFIRRVVALSYRDLRLDGGQVFAHEYARVRDGRSLRDALYVTLRKLGRPAHASELARAVRRTYPVFTRVTNPLVARRLRGRDFMRVKLAVFGLEGWGLPNYRHQLEAVTRVIEKHRGPMTEEAVLAALEGHSPYTREQIQSALHDQHWFSRPSPGLFAVRPRKLFAPKSRRRSRT